MDENNKKQFISQRLYDNLFISLKTSVNVDKITIVFFFLILHCRRSPENKKIPRFMCLLRIIEITNSYLSFGLIVRSVAFYFQSNRASRTCFYVRFLNTA